MKKTLFFIAALSMSCVMTAEQAPIFYESFDRCVDDDESETFTGGNDGEWSGNVGTSVVIYFDNGDSENAWHYDNAKGANQCVKVGSADSKGYITTPKISYSGDATLTFRAAPWDGTDEKNVLQVFVSGGTANGATSFELEKKKWNDLSIPIVDIKGNLQVTFSTVYSKKNRFFLDEVKVIPADPSLGAIRVEEGTNIDLGVFGQSYKKVDFTLHIHGENISSEGISATLKDGNADHFQLSSATLPAEGGELTITLNSGLTDRYNGCYLDLHGKSKKGDDVDRRVTISFEVTSVYLEGNGIQQDPYTCNDLFTLEANPWEIYANTRYWVTGYVIGGVKRYNEVYDDISYEDKLSLVIAADPNETNANKYVTVQISDDARAALNIVDNPELIGQQIKVNGILAREVNNEYNPYYLGKVGVRDVRTDEHYVRPAKETTGSECIQPSEIRNQKVLRDGQLIIITPDGMQYNVLGIRSK